MNGQCKLCAMGVGYGQGMTQRELANKYGIGKSSVARHRRHLSKSVQQGQEHLIFEQPESDATVNGDPRSLQEFLDRHGIEKERLDARAVSYQDPDGGWVKYAVNAETVEEALSYDDLDFSIPDFMPTDIGVTTEGDFLAAADWQIGKASEKGGGTPETMARIRRGFSAFARRLDVWKPAEAAMCDGGDIIENIWNTPSQPFTNDLDLTAQIRTARRLFWEGIKLFAPKVQRLVVVGVPSNHGGARVGKQAQAGTTEADYGLDIGYALEEKVLELQEVGHLLNVEFVRPEPLEETAVFDLAGTRIAVNHGHNSGNINKHHEWWAKQDHGRMPGWDADILVLNHFHNQRTSQSGNGRHLINTASPDGGSAWYAYKTGETSKAGQTAFRVSGGEWSDISTL